MSWLDDVIKKVAESAKIATQSDNIAKVAETLTQHQDKLATATSDVINKEMPNIQQGIGADVLAQAIQQQQPRLQPSTSKLGSTINVPTQYGQIQGANEMTPDMAKIANTPARESRENGITKNLGSDLGKFMQSIGYGMLDKPLGRDASTWDYLGKTIGQIARVNEGSGLGAGQPIYNDTSVQYAGLQQDLAKIPDTVIADPNAKMLTYRELLRKYPKLQSFLSEYFGLTRSYEYNYPQGPAPKYNLGNPTGAPVGVE